MSYDIELIGSAGTAVEVPKHTEGSVVALGGMSTAEMSVTYNYSYFYYNEIDEDEGIRWFDGKTANETVDILVEAIDTLGDEPHRDCDNYGCPSMGRAGAALATMLDWARHHPDAEWKIR